MDFNADWRKRSIIRHATKAEIETMIETHYLHKHPAVVPCRLAMLVDSHIVGMIVFAYPPRQTISRYGGMTWELARLWVDDDVPRNGETWLIGRAVKHVRQAHPTVDVLVSYADPAHGHNGLIYRAANWTPDGMTDDERRTPRFDYRVNGKMYSRRSHIPDGATWARVPRVSKHRFIYRLKKQHRAQEAR